MQLAFQLLRSRWGGVLLPAVHHVKAPACPCRPTADLLHTKLHPKFHNPLSPTARLPPPSLPCPRRPPPSADRDRLQRYTEARQAALQQRQVQLLEARLEQLAGRPTDSSPILPLLVGEVAHEGACPGLAQAAKGGPAWRPATALLT